MALAVRSLHVDDDFLIIATKQMIIDDPDLFESSNVEFFNTDQAFAEHFFNIEITSSKLLLKLSEKSPPKKLLTFYDTHVLFLFLRDKFNVNWKDVGLIEDGLGNYIKLSMPRWRSRLVKSVFNKVSCRYSYPSCRFSLGLNSKIPLIYTINKPDVICHETCEVVDVQHEYWDVINFRYNSPQKIYSSETQIVMVPPLLKVRRASESYIKEYVNQLLSSACSDMEMVFKVHPREGAELQRIISSICSQHDAEAIFLDASKPIEQFFFAFKKFSLYGPPSTACIIANAFFREKLVEPIKLIPDPSNPFGKGHINYFSSRPDYKVISGSK